MSPDWTISMKICVLLACLGWLGSVATGCTEGQEDEEGSSPIGESLHVVPEVYEDATEEMTCREVGMALGNWNAHGWVDCTLDLSANGDGEQVFDSTADFTGSEQCAELLELSLRFYETEEGSAFDWTSLNEELISAVLVKDGTRGNLYDYFFDVGEDAGLHAPDANGIWGEVDHISFCVDRSLSITHAARADVSPQYDWEVELTADPMVLELEDEETGEVTYHIRVSATEAGEFQRLIVGTAFLSNLTEFPAEVEAIFGEVEGSEGPAEVDCGVSFPFTLESNQGIECNYAIPVSEEIGFTATVEVTVVMTETSPVRGVYTEYNLFPLFPSPEQFEALTILPVREVCEFEEQPCEFSFAESYTCPFDDGLQRVTAGSPTTSNTDQVEVMVDCAPTERRGFLSVFFAPRPGFLGPYVWDIDITADRDVLPLGGFESGSVNFEIVASAEDIGESFSFVEGEVFLGNATDFDAEIASVRVEVNGLITEADCGMETPFVMPARSSLECSFFARDVDPSSTFAEVIVEVTPESDLYGGSAREDILVDSPGTEPLETVNIDSGDLAETCTYPEVCVFEREIEFQCPEDGGLQRVSALIRQTRQRAEASVEVICDAEFEGALRVRTVPIGGFFYFYDWSIEKTADRSMLSLKNGESGRVNYWVELIPSEINIDYFVEGEMFITNETEFRAEIASAEVLVDGEVAAQLDCGVSFPYVLEAFQGLGCTYRAENLTGQESILEVNVSAAPGSQLVGQRFQLDFRFTNRLPLEETFYEITVRDELNGEEVFEETCLGDFVCTYEYEKTYRCPVDEGIQVNEIEILETGDSDTSEVQIFCEKKKR